MCLLAKAPKVPMLPERQAVQVPKDPSLQRTDLNARRRRGMWAAVMTSPQGATGPLNVTGTGAQTLGGG